MGRRKLRQLEQAVIDAARIAIATGDAVDELDTLMAVAVMRRAVAALDAYVDTNLEGRGAIGMSSPDTSIAPALERQYRLAGLRRAIVEEIHAVTHANPDTIGLCSHEIERRLRRQHSSVSAAITALTERGILIDSKTRRSTPSQFDAIVWTLSPAYLTHLRTPRSTT